MKGRGREGGGWGGLFIGGPLRIVSLCGLCLLPGCASPQQRQLRADWRTICAGIPVEAGHHYTIEEQRAMNRQRIWSLSVEEVNRRCQ